MTPPGGSEQTLAENVLYKPYGGIKSFVYGNGILRNVGYDNQYRVSSIQSAAVQHLGYVPDANGNVETLNNVLDSSRNKTFGYDALDRLATAAGPWGDLDWTYDGVGNRLTQTSEGLTKIYSYYAGTNRLRRAGLGSPLLAYDNAGNLVGEGSKVYTYDDTGRLGAVANPMYVSGYGYYANGQRAHKAVGPFDPVITGYHYGQLGELLAETDVNGTTTVDYIYLNGEPLAKVTGSTLTYIHPDHLGSPAVMTNSAGTKVWEIESRPFGDAPVITGTSSLNLRFPGQYFDEETGLHQNRYRHYGASLGRYHEVDPLLDIVGAGVYYRARFHDLISKRSVSILSVRAVPNPYGYADSNPIGGSDPTGLISLKTYSSTYELSGVIPNLDDRAAICPWKAESNVPRSRWEDRARARPDTDLR